MIQWSYWIFIIFHFYANKIIYNAFPNLKETISWVYSFFISSTMCFFLFRDLDHLINTPSFSIMTSHEKFAMNFYLAYLVVDALRIWNNCFNESKLYFYHHIIPTVSSFILPFYHFHFVIISMAESNIPLFCIDMGLGVFLKEIKCLNDLPTIVKKIVQFLQKNHQSIKKLDAWMYLLCRIIGIGGYLSYIIYLCGFDCKSISYWKFNLSGLIAFWSMYIIWGYKMMRRAYGIKPK